MSLACGGAEGSRARRTASNDSGDEQVEERDVVGRLPDGSVKRTRIRTTRRKVPAPPPPPRPADPYPPDPLVRYNVEQVNAYGARKKLPPLLYDAKISAFATRGSEQLARDHTPHAHFAKNAQGAPGLGSKSERHSSLLNQSRRSRAVRSHGSRTAHLGISQVVRACGRAHWSSARPKALVWRDVCRLRERDVARLRLEGKTAV
jgi:hypothetical protein